jgi:dolichol-phosphate mannosyltransferase
MFLSIVSPVYKAADLLPELVRQIEEAAKQITDSYEIILVEDYSPDASREVIKKLCCENSKVKGIFLSRNFGQHYAISAGFDNSSGEWIVTLDCDLQDIPKYIVNLFEKTKEGYDIVYASRQNREDSLIKILGSKYFNKIISYLTGIKRDPAVSNFVLYNRKTIEAMKMMGDYSKFYPLMNRWVGFRNCQIPVPHALRYGGGDQKSSYSYSKRIILAFDTIISFSNKPLLLILLIGIIIMFISSLLILWSILNYFFADYIVKGWVPLIASIWFLSGIIIVLLGVIGLYIGKIFEETKKRPIYIISEKINFN